MAMMPRDEYHLTFLSDQGLVSRLVHEVSDEYQLTWPEFKRDPFGFTKRTFVGYGNLFMKFLRKPNVLLGMGAAFSRCWRWWAWWCYGPLAIGASSRVGLVVFAIFAGGLLIALFSTWLGRERGAAVMGAEPSDSRSVVAAMIASFVFLFAILGIIVAMDRRHGRTRRAEPGRRGRTSRSDFRYS